MHTNVYRDGRQSAGSMDVYDGGVRTVALTVSFLLLACRAASLLGGVLFIGLVGRRLKVAD